MDLASKFKNAGAKAGNMLAVINKGKNMQTGGDYMVTQWKKPFDIFYYKKNIKKKFWVKISD